MFKRILTIVIAAAMLAAIAPAAIADGGEASPIVTDALAPFAVADGEIAVSLGTSGNELLACFADKADLTLSAADGSALSPTEAIASGVTVSRGGESVVAIVPGDVTGDAVINVRDAIAAMRVALGSTDGAVASAADVNADGAVNSRDVIKLMRSLVGWNENFGADREAAEADDEALTIYFASSMQRISRDDTAIHGSPDGVIRMAKNEIEDAHMILVSTENKTDLTLEVGDIANAAGDVLEREVRYGYYYSCGIFTDHMHQSRENQDWQGDIASGWYSDPYPTLNAPFAVGANENQSFIVKVKTTAESAAGWYKAPVRVLDSDGNELKKATLWVYVWDFALDETPACKTLFGMDPGQLAWGVSVYDGTVWTPAYANDWYEYAVENRISSYGLPQGDYTDRYMDDPRVTAFCSATGSRVGSDFDDPTWVNSLKSTYNHLSTKQEWMDKAYIYDVDEPWGTGGAQAVVNQWNNAKAALGDTPFKVILPLTSNCWIAEENRDMFDACYDYCNAICPQSNCFTISATRRERKKNKEKYPEWGEYMDDAQLAKYGQFRPRYETLRERGDDMWWYICIGPQAPYANWWLAQQGAANRAVLWQQYYYDIDGILYWSMTAWNMGEYDSRKINLKRINNGDGLLLYNGSLWDETREWVKGKDPSPLPVPSIRFEAVRDGIEDFQYLRQLERALGEDGRDAALEYTYRVTTDILDYSDDYHDIENARRDMGFVLEGLACKVADQ